MRLHAVLVLAALLGSTVVHSQDGYTVIDQELWLVTRFVAGINPGGRVTLLSIDPLAGEAIPVADLNSVALGGLASSAGVGCGLVNQPAATLLVPYFEVDLEEPGGRDTLISIGTAEPEAALVRAVLWTNWGLPALSFDFVVPAKGVRPLRLRDLVLGQLPQTSPPAGTFASCTDPLRLPEVDTESLLARLTGRPDPADGLCHSSPVADGLATGYLTVDVVRDCSGDRPRTPLDDDYFGEGGSGLATNDNLLWGSFFLVDPANDFAQGENAVAILADATRFGSEIVCVTEPCTQRITTTFYGSDDNRMPLARAYQARFLRGGGFAGETELVLWQEGRTDPTACEVGPATLSEVDAVFHNESGVLTDVQSFVASERALRVLLGGERLPTAERFGSVDLRSFTATTGQVSAAQQLWVMPLIGAEGRYSVGATAVPIEDFCSD